MDINKPAGKRAVNCPGCNHAWNGRTDRIGESTLLVCSRCQLRFCNPAELAGVDYDEVYESESYREYIDSLERTAWRKLAKFITYRPFFLKVPRAARSKLLDIGCGVGLFCRAAYAKGWDVKGIDISGVAVAKGARTAPFPLLNATAEDFIKSGEQFDAVTAFEVLEHIISPLDFLNKASALVKKGGIFFCTVPNIESHSVRTATRRDWLPPIHVLFFNQAALHQILIRSGFTGVQSGVIWADKRPSLPGLEFFIYCLKKSLGRTKEPDPVGLWALGVKL
ncbi:MAG: class I SAM-dependent methyltransferase [Nitrospiraceae bacterium]|nr:class I SAM-dependent methyltransferase [Nitrospiraceae bacterium]